MKIYSFLAGLSLMGLACGQAPYPPSGSKPQGALLILPSRQQYVAPSAQQVSIAPSVSLERVGALITEKLRQAEGAESGNYFVSLPDGRYQNLRYTAAPLKQPPAFHNTQQFSLQNAQSFGSGYQASQQSSQQARQQGYTEGRTEPEESANEAAASDQHAERLSGKQPNRQQKPEKAEPADQPEASQQDAVNAQLSQQQLQQLQEQQQWAAAYIAAVQFAQVQPVAAPIYSFAPAPLVRILRQAPRY